MLQQVLKKVFGTKHERELKRMQPMVEAINALEPEMKRLPDDALRGKTGEFKEMLDRGASLDDLLVPAFAVCREAARRTVGMRHYDVQLIGGMVLHDGKIAEMKTGEGKTLVATLPCYLNGLEGKGVHVVTVNDYLATRDAEWMGRVHNFLGLSVGTVVHHQGDTAKKRAYRADVTYGQNNEFGFDYLRDNMKFSIFDYAQRELNFAIVDEVDSILIDEARTPLIISGPGKTASEKYRKVAEVVPRLRKDDHYEVDEKARHVTLTEDGMEFGQRRLHEAGLTEVENLYDPVNLETLHILQQSLRAHALYKRDRDYMVTPDGKVMIIDEFTGRVLAGRRWSEGLHQAVEAKERVPIQDENITLATISFQNLFRLYNKLSGMTGTADTEAAEFHKIYKLDVTVIPTNKPIARVDGEDIVYRTEREKFKAISEEIADCHERGQPVLVGTTSVEKSEVVARLLDRKGIPHEVLNAKQHEREAYVVAQAGRPGAVTVATNMAGRGTDILLGGNPEMIAKGQVLRDLEADDGPYRGAPEDLDERIEARAKYLREECERDKKRVLDAGGLHILGTERHESRRIDNQLRGRAGRQGDPGSSRFFLSLEDDLMRIFGGERLQTMMTRLGMQEDEPIEHRWVTRGVENAQKKVEERNFDIRKNMLEYDDVLNQQRKSVYTLRRQILTGQYRTVPTDEEREKGVVPEPVIKEKDDELVRRAGEVLEPMVKHHAAPLVRKDAPPEEIEEAQRAREAMLDRPLSAIRGVRPATLQKDIYTWFGCRIDLAVLEKLSDDGQALFDHCLDEVGMSLSEQKERLYDLVDEIVGTMVEHACPPGKHFEDWDLDGLSRAYQTQFGIEATGLDRITDAQELAEKLYGDAEAIIKKKEKEFGPENYLRLFRNFYMQEIDKQWIDQLQAMDHLRDGIGLRGYGQRDPKKEYKREGFDMFLQMMQGVKSQVSENMFRVVRVTEEDLQRQEAQRKAQSEARQRSLRAAHPGADGDGAAAPASGASTPGAGAPPGGLNRRQRRRQQKRTGTPGAPAAAAATTPRAAPTASPAPATVKRDRPKLGRNDPCWCGSGKKYKACHYREDQAAATAG